MYQITTLFIIAGPQSSGKTTVFNLLKENFTSATFIPEINQYVIKGKQHLGGVFVRKELELKLAEEDVKTIKNIDRGLSHVIIETGIFHLLYVEKICGNNMAARYMKKYIKAHKSLHPILLFIDTKPAVSWKRRRKNYLERVKRAGVVDSAKKKEIMETYKKRIFDLYPLWHKYYRLLPFEKYIIKNSYKSEGQFRAEFMERFNKLIT